MRHEIRSLDAPGHRAHQAQQVAPTRLRAGDYRIDPAKAAEFHRLITALRRSRLRDGAYAWHLYRPLEEEGVLRETFLLHSWLDHLRQHERVTEAERRLQEEIRALLPPGELPVARHHLPASTPG